MILACLVAVGVIERRRGRYVRVRCFDTLAELDSFQHAHEERRVLDRQLLSRSALAVHTPRGISP